ncbi:hypothetical protein SAMN05660964_00162 [Thiothrix caldifontis]|uniref:YtkA-like n=1 Tax=Thiothrix caldifontis TaxID=525918 RepID=A0A1H3VP87_9GAMM|nr:hypothetical protein [Thiothrix caldifontis]SDZ75912.1 hypothetical protein SAMN05660964_00162 [Thiothrix caldifontis]
MSTKWLTLILSLLLAGCYGSHTTVWERQQTSDKALYQAELTCATLPTVGVFQDCVLRLDNTPALPSDLLIAVDGGMPSHGHGLPTAPQAIPTGKPGEFRIDGLKYSMPGEWVLGFLLHSALVPSAQDKIVFWFTL